ncbi:MAG: hypothetical protein R2724_04615 [Bryobacterales bacterium]
MARPGDVVLLYGTGFGPTTAQPGQAADLEHIKNISITIGGADAQVLYAGTAPTFVGLQQFNVVVPNLAPGTTRWSCIRTRSSRSRQSSYRSGHDGAENCTALYVALE